MSARPFSFRSLRFNFPGGKRFPLFAKNDAMQVPECPRVLYVEDHEDTRELVTLVLEQKSYEVVSSSTIKSGVALAGSKHFDLYLLDSWLPDGSGLDLCRQIREFDKVTPIVFYSAAAYEIDRTQAMECGAQAYLVKPSQPSELCSVVTSLIELHRRLPYGSGGLNRNLLPYIRRPDTPQQQSCQPQTNNRDQS